MVKLNIVVGDEANAQAIGLAKLAFYIYIYSIYTYIVYMVLVICHKKVPVHILTG